jgi:hypothetical protein
MTVEWFEGSIKLARIVNVQGMCQTTILKKNGHNI